MFIIIVWADGNGNEEYTSPQLTAEQVTEEVTALNNALGSEMYAELSWGAFRGSNIANYRVVPSLPS